MKYRDVGVVKGPCPRCTSSDAFVTFANGSKHCFSCEYHEQSERTIESIKSSYTVGKKDSASALELPYDFDYHLPETARHWLEKYFLTPAEIQTAKIGWSDWYYSIVFPVFDGRGGPLLMYQMRYFG